MTLNLLYYNIYIKHNAICFFSYPDLHAISDRQIGLLN